MEPINQATEAPTMAPMESSEGGWQGARVTLLVAVLGVLLLRILVGFACARRRGGREARERTERSETEREEIVEEIQRKLKTVKWSDMPASADTSVASSDSDTDEERSVGSCIENDPLHSCSICFGKFDKEELVCQSNDPDCPHIYHKECMEEWLMKNDQCPICRRPYLSPKSTTEENEEEELPVWDLVMKHSCKAHNSLVHSRG